jgi:hypothetical protein
MQAGEETVLSSNAAMMETRQKRAEDLLSSAPVTLQLPLVESDHKEERHVDPEHDRPGAIEVLGGG